jgi:RNA polymerase sigma-70 factor (ECF subfamily)
MHNTGVNHDLILVSKLREGDPESFEKLYHKHFAKLYNFCLNLTQSNNDADEIVQETFIKIWEKRVNIDPERNFLAYMFTIARHKVYKRSIQRIKNYDIEQYYSVLLSKRNHFTE